MRPLLLVFSLLIVGGNAAEATATEPMAWIPAEVNAVARINVAEIYQSSLAQKEGWLKKATEAFIQQDAFIPPGTKQILIGAELDLSDNLIARRKYSVLVPDADLKFEKLAPWLPGGIEQVSGKSIAPFGNNEFIADAGDGCWLISESSSRQLISRWLQNGPVAGGNLLSQYLRNALNSKENSAQVLLAIDLKDNFSVKKIREELNSTDWFKSESAAETAAEILGSVHGITIGINVDKERTGFATIEFGRDTPALTPVLGKLVGAILNRTGASSDEIFDWKWTAKGITITGTGPVSPGGARRLVSILDPSSVTQAISASSTSAEGKAEDLAARSSRQYSKSIRVLLDDLHADLEKHPGNLALYMGRYARKIDDLPRLHVDSAMLEFGAKVSRSLRFQEQNVRLNRLNSATAKAQNQSGGSNYYGYNYVGSYAATAENMAVMAIDARSNQAKRSVQITEMKNIEDGFVDIRRAMTEKYQIEF